ncbi:hypothetical protein J7E87_22455 [Streptomyces sp. ISL-1]|uniref:hypothetical protein n=1 Tax=Streptomyces sp. ISL-1 TaxID=2817657 RepID=UPI001BECA186|nr:hypothetical protein [Streptomyces sp. ISL-1]MBT2392114.1 hypothetical protein [Streptomyces sp. ISL-1]
MSDSLLSRVAAIEEGRSRMSELVTAAAVIAPFISTAAASFTGAVVESAQTRIADSAVDRGQRFLARLLNRGADDPPQTPQETDAVAVIERLEGEDRKILAAAVGKWLVEEGDLSAEALSRHIERAHETYHSGDTFHVTSHGEGAAAIGKVHTANFTYNPRPEREARS